MALPVGQDAPIGVVAVDVADERVGDEHVPETFPDPIDAGELRDAVDGGPHIGQHHPRPCGGGFGESRFVVGQGVLQIVELHQFPIVIGEIPARAHDLASSDAQHGLVHRDAQHPVDMRSEEFRQGRRRVRGDRALQTSRRPRELEDPVAPVPDDADLAARVSGIEPAGFLAPLEINQSHHIPRFYRPARPNQPHSSPQEGDDASAAADRDVGRVLPSGLFDGGDVRQGRLHGRRRGRRDPGLLFGAVFPEQVGSVPFLRLVQVDQVGLVLSGGLTG